MGVHHIERAYASLSNETRARLPLQISRKPFFLYPAAMQHTVPSAWGERVSKLYSPAAWAGIVALGSEAGFAFDGAAPLSDTMDSHRLMVLAEQRGKQRAVVHEVSRRYFEEGVPLNDRRSLVEVAEANGVHGAADYLASDAGKAEVLESVSGMRAAGIRSIPVALISSGDDYRTTVHGSASAEEFGRVFREIEAHWRLR